MLGHGAWPQAAFTDINTVEAVARFHAASRPYFCGLNDNQPSFILSTRASKPKFDYPLTFFESWVSSACGSVFDTENPCQKHDIYLHILSYTKLSDTCKSLMANSGR